MWGAGALPEKSDWDPLGPAPRLLQPRSAQQPRAVRRRTDADAFAPEPKQQQQGRGFAAAPQQARARGSDANLPAPQRQQQYQQVYEPAHQPSTSYTDAGYEDAEFWPGPANGAPAFPGAQRDHGFGDILARGDGAGAAAADAAAGEGFPQAAGGPAGRPRPGVGVVQPISVLAALYQGATLGLAVYDGLSSEISILQCHDEIKGPLAFQMLALAKAQVVPQVLLLSARAEPAAVEAARAALPPGTGAEAVAAEGAPEGGAGAGPAARPEVRLERSATFGFDNARKRLPRALLLRSWPPGLSGREAAVRLAACVDLGQQAAVGALGALLAYMLREGISTQGGYGGGGGGGGEGAYGEEGEEGGGAGGSTAGAAVVVDRLSQLTMQGLLHVDLPTLYGLQVFAVEKHPSAMGLGKPKEGFSLYGLANRCVTQMGRRLLRLWFLRPVVNLEVISDRQDIIELLLRNGGELVGPLRAELKKLPDVASLLSRLTAAQQRPDLAAMQQLQNCLLQLLRLRAIFAQQLAPGLAAAAAAAAAGGRAWEAPSPAPSGATDAGGGLRWEAVSLSAKVLAHVPESLQEALDLVRSVLDPDQDEDGLMVAAEVCPALDRLKAAYRALPQHLTQVVESELRRVPRCLVRPNLQQLWSVLYLPQVGFVLKVQGAQLTADLLDALPDYELAFEGAAGPEEAEPGAAEGAGSVGAAGGQGAGWAAYYRTQSTLDLNARFGDLRYKIQDLESSLIAELMARLLEEHGPVMQRAAAVAGELDCLLSLAALAAERGYRRPLLTEGTGLRIVNGRHPLAEMVVEPYIPFSTAMEEGGEAVAAAAAAALGGSGHAASGSGGGPDGLGGRLQVVTGPNASGKSCYARAVALIAFLAHVGSFVPADEAEIGRADRIAARLAAPSGGAAVLLGAAGAGGGAGGGGAAADGGGGGGGLTGGGALRPSTFLADLTQVSAMLRNATHRSLLVLDEFGKGTLASDGVGLTSALLQYFAAGGAAGALGAPSDQATITSPCTAGAGPAGPPPPPRLILATHFHELFRPGVLPPCRHLAFLQMEVLTQRLPPPQAQHGPGTGAGAGAGPGARSGAAAQGLLEAAGQGRVEAGEAGEEDEHEHVFLYRLVPGRCPASFGVHCARLAGVDEAVCVRAKEVIAALQRGGTVGRWRGVTRSAAVQGELAALERLKAAAALPAAERNVALCAILRGSDAPTGGEEQGPEAAAP